MGDGVSLALVHACVCALPADTRLDWTILGVNAIPFIAPPQCQLTQEQWESRNLCMGKLTLDTKGIAIVHLHVGHWHSFGLNYLSERCGYDPIYRTPAVSTYPREVRESQFVYGLCMGKLTLDTKGIAITHLHVYRRHLFGFNGTR